MKWLKTRRKELRMSQEDVARLLQLQGYDFVRSTIGHWESGHAAPPLGDPHFVKALASILKLDVTTLLILSGYDITSNYSEISERIARTVESMPQEKRTLALKLVEQLLD